jgi:hypothetical protein
LVACCLVVWILDAGYSMLDARWVGRTILNR